MKLFIGIITWSGKRVAVCIFLNFTYCLIVLLLPMSSVVMQGNYTVHSRLRMDGQVVWIRAFTMDDVYADHHLIRQFKAAY